MECLSLPFFVLVTKNTCKKHYRLLTLLLCIDLQQFRPLKKASIGNGSGFFFSHSEKNSVPKKLSFFPAKLNSDRPKLRYSFFFPSDIFVPLYPSKTRHKISLKLSFRLKMSEKITFVHTISTHFNSLYHNSTKLGHSRGETQLKN